MPKPRTTRKPAAGAAAQADRLRVEYAPIGAFIPYARNSRTHSPAQIARLRASIREFGFTNPVLTDGAMGILAGHARLEAARLERPDEEVPYISLGHLPEAKRRAYVIADNRLAELAEWDIEMLALEAADAVKAGIELETIGFSDDELRELLGDVPGAPGGEGAQPGDDEVPEPPKVAVSRPGDLWVIGDHRILCGSATVDEDVDRLMAGERAVMAFTDPPYNVDYQGGKVERSRIKNDALGDDFPAFLRAGMASLLRVTDGACYVAMSCAEMHTLRAAFEAAGGHYSCWIAWVKDVFAAGFADYRQQFEPILYGWRDGAERHWCGRRDQSTVWEVARVARCDLHPTMKPVELVIRAIENSSPRNGVVLDLFAGSGTTGMAAIRTGRQARLMELDPAYVDVIVARLADATLLPARLDGDGRTFAEVRRERQPGSGRAAA